MLRPTPEEMSVIGHLKNAWDAFAKLDCSVPEDATEFLGGIHECEKILILRVARRADPDNGDQDA